MLPFRIQPRGNLMDFDSTLFSIGKNRCRTEIAATIISLAQDRQSDTEIMEKAHLNSRQLERYLEELTKLDLVEVKLVDGRTVCSATQGGKRFLKQYYTLMDFLG
jgi:predicted transcriptional regulator